jgi:hypothetical protein
MEIWSYSGIPPTGKDYVTRITRQKLRGRIQASGIRHQINHRHRAGRMAYRLTRNIIGISEDKGKGGSMDVYDCGQTDKMMNRRINTIYGDPKRHKFVSTFDVDESQDVRGPRGGKMRGSKKACFYCGEKAKGHAEVTEQI